MWGEVGEMNMALPMGVVAWPSTSCLWRQLFGFDKCFWVVLVRVAGPSGSRRRAGEFICRESVVCGWESWARSCGEEAKRVVAWRS